MDNRTPAAAEQVPSVMPLVVRPRPTLAKTSGSLALRAARRAMLALVRREPGALLTVGFGAGLIARTAVRGLVAARSARAGALARTSESPEVLGVEVQTLSVRTVRYLRRT